MGEESGSVLFIFGGSSLLFLSLNSSNLVRFLTGLMKVGEELTPDNGGCCRVMETMILIMV